MRCNKFSSENTNKQRKTTVYERKSTKWDTIMVHCQRWSRDQNPTRIRSFRLRVVYFLFVQNHSNNKFPLSFIIDAKRNYGVELEPKRKERSSGCLSWRRHEMHCKNFPSFSKFTSCLLTSTKLNRIPVVP